MAVEIRFCDGAAGSGVKKNGFFLRRRVVRQEFHVEILTPEVDCQEFHVEILTPEVDCQEFHVEILHRSQNLFKKHVLHQELCIFTLKIFLFAHFFLHLPTSFLNNKHQ